MDVISFLFFSSCDHNGCNGYVISIPTLGGVACVAFSFSREQLQAASILLHVSAFVWPRTKQATRADIYCYVYTRGWPPRRSTIEVHPEFSEAPHFRSSIPHPKTDCSKNQNASRRKLPWPKSTKSFFSKSRLAFRRFGVKQKTSFRNKIAEMCYLYRRTGPLSWRTPLQGIEPPYRNKGLYIEHALTEVWYSNLDIFDAV